MNSTEFKQAIIAATTPLPGSYPKEVNYKLTVKKRHEGLSIIDFFCEAVPRSTPQIWFDKIVAGNLKVNYKQINKTYQVKAGDITTHISEPKIEPKINTTIQLIYADKDILVVNKPSPLPVHSSGRFVRNTLISILGIAFPNDNFKLLHRLDANTTGVIVIAKNKTTAHHIQQQFKNKTVKKEYFALVEGIVEPDFLNLEAAIGKNVLVGGAREIDETGKVAKTEVEVIERRIDNHQTLLKVIPSTGRTNQIRLHLANMSHPIVGDVGYKDQNYFKNNPFTYPKDSLFLHAQQLEIIHPTSNKKMIFQAELPAKFNLG
jgi:23S rRNA pseudouridine1911/1915/1917 synthase